MSAWAGAAGTNGYTCSGQSQGLYPVGVHVRGGAESNIQWAQVLGVDPEQHPIGLHVGGGANVFKSRLEEQVYMLE